MAEAAEALESCQTSTCSTLDSDPTSDLKDPKIPGDVDSWCELPRLIELRTKFRTEMNNTETRALTLEQEICENRVSKEKTLCGACGFVREPRQRKIAELRLMHKDMLKSKPKHLLCTAGIITRLETMILEGLLDCGSTNTVTRCLQCRQESNEATMKRYLMSEFLDILKHQLDNCTNTENCSMTEACSNCLCFMQLCLTKPEKFMAEYLGSKKDDTSLDAQNSNVSDKPEDEPVLDQELSNDADEPIIIDQDVTYADTEANKILATMQSEFSEYKTILTKHLDSFNTIHDQLKKRLEQERRKQRNEAHLYMTVQVLLEDSFDGHQGNDLYDPDKANFRKFRVRKQMTLQQLRPWPFCFRGNKTCRPAFLDMETQAHTPIIDVAGNANHWSIFLETVMPDSGMVKDESEEGYEQHTCKDYFRDLLYRVEVTFCNKTIPNDPGFTMVLSYRFDYNQMAKAVAERLGTDPYLLQFFKSLNYKDSPGHLVCCTYNGSLQGLLVYSKPKQPKKVPNGKEEKELILFPNKRGTVADLLEEAWKQVELSENGTGRLRLFEQSCYKIIYSPSDECPLEQINTTTHKTYRIEEVPHDEVILAKDEILVPVAHFSKDVYATFGTPIVVKVKHGESFPKVKERIQKKLGLPEKEFERIKFTVVVMGRAIYINDDSDYFFSADDFNFGERPSQVLDWSGPCQ
ncbi:hypothetical protein B566_EDAN016060 [Ephemera danica]|nr:hypothetical protein B566_EDAN016060 [Ephemera danica]